MISPSSFPRELRKQTPTILKLLSNNAMLDVKTITRELYEIETDNNKRKTRQLLEALEDSKILRCEMGKRQRKPVLTNLEIATALFDQIDKTTLDCVAVATNTIAMRSGL